jgi:hypothetical protein
VFTKEYQQTTINKMKKMFYLMPDFIVRFWCKVFKCSKIESQEQELDHEADWNKIVDKMHENSRQNPDNPNITIVTWPLVKVENKTKLIKSIILECFIDSAFKTTQLAQIVINERNYDISKKDISRILSRFYKKKLLLRFYKAEDCCYCYVPKTKFLLK